MVQSVHPSEMFNGYLSYWPHEETLDYKGQRPEDVSVLLAVCEKQSVCKWIDHQEGGWTISCATIVRYFEQEQKTNLIDHQMYLGFFGLRMKRYMTSCSGFLHVYCNEVWFEISS